MTTGAPYSVERLLAAFAKVPAHVAVVRGPNHVYAFLNDAYTKIVGVEDPIGKPFGASNHAATAALRVILDRVYTTGAPFNAPEMRIDAVGNDPADRYFNVNFVPLRGEDNEIDGVMLHSFDVTELVRARQTVAANEAQLLHVQKLESLGVLAGGIAHDFNNMLAAVQGSISLGALMLSPEHPVQSALRDALGGVRRAAELTRQLLAYSGKGHFQIQRMHLSTHVEELSNLLETTLPKKVQLRLDLAKDLPPIDADPAQIQQVVMNLVINAAEAMADERGTVLVTTGTQKVDRAYASSLLAPAELADGLYVFLEVHDTGCGMDEATKAKIFDPFFTTKFTGRGLGLAAVLGIVKSHKGAIKVYSTPGKGTTFKVYFAATEGTALERPAAPEPAFHGTGLALVVDDDAGVRLVIRHLLEYFGFQVVEASDGRRGVEAFAIHADQVRFVVLDMTMPELSGEETFRELRALRPEVPVILSSGYNEIEATRKFASRGFAAFLPKPFTPDDLARCIRAAVTPRAL